MRNLFLLFVASFFSLQNLSAQVKGIIIDSVNNSPLEKAVVGLVVKSNATDTTFTITNEKGEFSFEKVPSSNFSIIVTNVGYQTAAKFIPVDTTEKTIDLGNITLANLSKVLNEIVIQSSPIAVKEDTIEYRADAFKVKENAMVEDLLKKLPGIQVDKNGNIKAQGKTITRVKVNGKDFFGGDPKTATRELPANIVDKIQIVDDYGDQATISGIKDGEPEKVMNIQLKKDKNTGYFGRVTAGVGDQGRYMASLNGNYFVDKQQISFFSNSNNTSQALFNSGTNNGMANTMKAAQGTINTIGSSSTNTSGVNIQSLQNGGGQDGITTSNSFGFNYRDDWSKEASVFGSYTYSRNKSAGYKIISQQNIFSTGDVLNNLNNNFANVGENHKFVFNLEYNIDSFNYLKVSPAINYSTNNGNNRTVFAYFTANAKTSDGYNNLVSTANNTTLSGNILFNHRFNRSGRNFSVNFTAGRIENLSDQDSRNNTIQYILPAISTNLSLLNNLHNNSYNSSIRFTYTEPLSNNRFLDLAYSHNFSHGRNIKAVFNIDSFALSQIFNQGLSSDYQNDYSTDRANISIRTTEKKYNYTIGISAQPVNLRGFSSPKDSAYHSIKRVNIFPVARFAYNFSRTKTVNISYRGDAQQPSFSQLQDVLDISNPQYLTRGNPDLKPSISHSLNIFYNNFSLMTGRVLFTNLTLNTIENQIVNNTIRIGTSGTQLTIPQNVNGFYNVSGFYNYSMPFKNRLFVVTLNGMVNYNHNINLIDSLKNTGRNWIIGQGLNVQVNYKEWLEFTAGANYNLNSVNYSSVTANNFLLNTRYSSWIINSTINIDLAKDWVLKYDFDYTINQGLAGAVGQNPAIMNASIEKQLFKKKNGIIRFEAFDLFNQNSNISRTISANSIIDSRSNKLNRYFMLSFTYRLQKFSGKQSQSKNTINTSR